MKKTITILSAVLFFAFTGKAQFIADFENLVLPADSFYQDTTGADFTSGSFSFEYNWTLSSFGDYWSSGFAYSNKTDSVTSGYENQYSAKTAGGYNSSNYVVAYGSGIMRNLNAGIGHSLYACHITNSTYAYNSMRDGDMFAKKFGGPTGDDPDWFKVVFRPYHAGILSTTDSIEFYLADFRFSDNTQDYIVKTWEYVNLIGLAGADSIRFDLSSSDNSFGFMNTPAYFCMDDLETQNLFGLKEQSFSSLELFPNPATTVLNIKLNTPVKDQATYNIINTTGKTVTTGSIDPDAAVLNIGGLPSGIYFIRLMSGKEVISQKFIKD